jgi:hypothetical protein
MLSCREGLCRCSHIVRLNFPHLIPSSPLPFLSEIPGSGAGKGTERGSLSILVFLAFLFLSRPALRSLNFHLPLSLLRPHIPFFTKDHKSKGEEYKNTGTGCVI